MRIEWLKFANCVPARIKRKSLGFCFLKLGKPSIDGLSGQRQRNTLASSDTRNFESVKVGTGSLTKEQILASDGTLGGSGTNTSGGRSTEEVTIGPNQSQVLKIIFFKILGSGFRL